MIYTATLANTLRFLFTVLKQEDSYCSESVEEFAAMNLKSAGFLGGGQERFRSLSSAPRPKMLKQRRDRSVSPPPALEVDVAKVT